MITNVLRQIALYLCSGFIYYHVYILYISLSQKLYSDLFIQIVIIRIRIRII